MPLRDRPHVHVHAHRSQPSFTLCARHKWAAVNLPPKTTFQISLFDIFFFISDMNLDELLQNSPPPSKRRPFPPDDPPLLIFHKKDSQIGELSPDGDLWTKGSPSMTRAKYISQSGSFQVIPSQAIQGLPCGETQTLAPPEIAGAHLSRRSSYRWTDDLHLNFPVFDAAWQSGRHQWTSRRLCLRQDLTRIPALGCRRQPSSKYRMAWLLSSGSGKRLHGSVLEKYEMKTEFFRDK